MRRGEVWWSAPELAGGSRKRRPVVIVSHDAFNANEAYDRVVVLHLTSVRRLGGAYDWDVDVPRGTAGLRRASIIKCSEVYTVMKRDLEQRAGLLPRVLVMRLNQALALTLDLPVPGEP